jgi:hypothetical protein
MKNTKSEAVYCERIRAALRNRGILGAEHGPNVNPRPFGECEKLLKEMYPAVFEEIKTAYLPKKLTCSPAVKAVRPVAGELDTFEICYDEWRACGHGDKWNVRDKAGALLLETQDGYADYKLPSQDAERIARLAASAPGLLAALDAIVNPNPDYTLIGGGAGANGAILDVPLVANARAAIAGARGESGQTCPHCGLTGQHPDSLKCDDCGKDLPARYATESHGN